MTVTVQINEQVTEVQVTQASVNVDVLPQQVDVTPLEGVVEVTATISNVTVTVDEINDVVNVTVQPGSEVAVTVTETVVDVDVLEQTVVVVTQDQQVNVNVSEVVVEVEVGLCVQTVASPSFLQTRIAGEDLLFANIVTVNSSNLLVKANIDIAGGLWEAIGATNAAYLSGQGAGFYAHHGRLTRLLFDVIPPASANGDIVYLGATGLASLTKPSLGGDKVVTLGVLSGADGVTIAPQVFFDPDYANLGKKTIDVEVTPASPTTQTVYTGLADDVVCLSRIWVETVFDEPSKISLGTLVDPDCLAIISATQSTKERTMIRETKLRLLAGLQLRVRFEPTALTPTVGLARVHMEIENG